MRPPFCFHAAYSLLQQTLGVDLKPVLALGGVGGIAAGFASQQILQNVVSGEWVHEGDSALLGLGFTVPTPR